LSEILIYRNRRHGNERHDNDVLGHSLTTLAKERMPESLFGEMY
jgi:hypothetical protein